MAAAMCITISKDKKPRTSASLYNSAKAAHHVTNELAAVCLIVIYISSNVLSDLDIKSSNLLMYLQCSPGYSESLKQ